MGKISEAIMFSINSGHAGNMQSSFHIMAFSFYFFLAYSVKSYFLLFHTYTIIFF